MSGDSITILALWLRKLSSLGISKISMFRPLEKIRQYSDSGINFQRISTKLKFEPCESIRYLLPTNSFGFGTLRTSTHGHGCSKQAAISQKEIVFRFRKDVQSEKGWGLMSCAKEVLVSGRGFVLMGCFVPCGFA